VIIKERLKENTPALVSVALSLGEKNDPDLDRVIIAWSTLSPDVRNTILKLIGTQND